MNDNASQDPADDLSPLRRALLAVRQMQAKVAAVESERTEPIAVVGVGCRFPGGVVDATSFWRLLRDGVDAVIEVPKARWNAEAHYDADPNAPGKMVTKWGGFVDDVDRFDPQFFGISPREAVAMDPQQRFLLEVAWEALEHAQIVPARLRGSKTGVFVGICTSDYAHLQVDAGLTADAYTGTGSAFSVAAGRLSYTFGFQGPSVALDTACSSSLVAIHLACQSLRARESELALAGGVNIALSPLTAVAMSKLGALSPDGRCRTLDAAANGYVRAEGCGIVVLKRLSDAIAAGDRVLALIRGSAVNQDGRSGGLTMPNGPAQEAAVRDALASGKVDPASVAYVEAHGTGTPLGDPIEIDALGKVLGPGRSAPFLVGSVKTNFGHAESAAGVAGLIKTVLALWHREIPPHLHFRERNPHISADVPMRVPTERSPWPELGPRRLAGVSAFGFSGTNAHVVVEEAPDRPLPPAPAPTADHAVHLLVLSAKDEVTLRALAARYEALLGSDEVDVRGVVKAAAVRRTHHPRRAAIVGADRTELRQALAELTRGEASTEAADLKVGVVRARGAKTVFVFPGQGAQWDGMGKRLLAVEPVFARAIDRCEEALGRWHGPAVRELLERGLDDAMKKRVDVVQPLLFSMQVGLAALFASWGALPDAVVGHSMGEVAAAHVAGALTLEDAAQIIAIRSQIVARASGRGAMAALELSRSEAESISEVRDGLIAVAAVNGPDSVILSGDAPAVRSVALRLEAKGTFCRLVDVDYASHCAHMDPLLPELVSALGTIAPNGRLRTTMISTVTGREVDPSELDAAYWGRNLREPVLFHDATEKLLRQGFDLFLELSPQPVLGHGIGRTIRHRHQASDAEAIASMRRDEDPPRTLRAALGALHVRGASVAWETLVDADAPFEELPLTPWRDERHWLDFSSRRTASASVGGYALLPEAWLSSRGDGARFFQGRLSLEALPWLADHVVAGSAVLAGAAYFNLALAAGRRALGESVRLEACELSSMMELGAAPTTVQVVLVPQGQRWAFQIASRTDEAETWTTHATGVLGPAREDAASIDLEAIRARCAEAMTADDFYAQMDAIGVSYGPTFRTITRVVRRDGEALAEVAGGLVDTAGYEVHPTLLDAALQTFGAACSREADGAFLPVGAASVRVLAPLALPLRCHAVVAPSASSGSSHLSGDVRLVGADGTVLVEVCGLRVQRVGRARLALGDWLYGLDWIASSRPDRRPSAGTWLVVGEGEASRDVRRLLEAEGVRVVGVADGVRGLGEVRGVLHLGALDPKSLEHAPHAGCDTLLAIVQALVEAGLRDPPRLFVATRRAQVVPVAPGAVEVWGAPLWGFVRSLFHEHPELRPTVIDVDDGPRALQALVAEILGADEEQQIALRGDHRWVARLARRDAIEREASAPGGRPFSLAIDVPGVLDRLTLREVTRRAPGPGEVEIEVHAAGLNFLDVLLALGVLPDDGPGASEGTRLGGECAGTVVRVGPGVTKVREGDEVVAVGPSCFASHVVVPSVLVVPKPAAMSMEVAAGIGVAFLTAHIALLQHARLERGERVLIHAAAGGVGLAAVALAKHAGAEIFATAGSEDKRAHLRALGVAHVMDSRSLDFVSAIREATAGEGIDVVLNSLAGEFIETSFDLLRDYGRFIEIGKRDYYADNKLGLRPFLKNLSFSLVDLRSMLRQRPERMRATLLEVLELLAAGAIEPPPTRVFPVSEVADSFRHMAQAKHIGKVVVTMKDPAARIAVARSPELSLRPDGTYLVTGGLGGIGLEVARWLARRGARHLVLVGRSAGAPSTAARSVIAELGSAGVAVVVEAADVAKEADVSRVFARIAASGHPLRGVVHAAGVLDDGVTHQQTPRRLADVMAPKVAGAWNLHRQTLEQGERIELFLLFSSAASLLGSPGQAGYAAGNAFLDALAHHRRAAGLPALSVNWGAWAEVGMVATHPERVASLAARGIRGLTTKQAVDALDGLAGSGLVQAAILPIEARQFSQAHPRAAASPFFACLRQAESPNGAAASTARRELAAAAPEDRARLLESLVQREVARVLHVAPARIDAFAPFGDFGFNSLMAIELKNRLETSLGIDLPTSLVWAHRSIAALAPKLAARLGFESEVEAASPATVDDLSNDEIAQELARELAALRTENRS